MLKFTGTCLVSPFCATFQRLLNSHDETAARKYSDICHEWICHQMAYERRVVNRYVEKIHSMTFVAKAHWAYCEW